MPQVRKLSADEVQTLQNKGKSQRKLVEQQYDAMLGDYAVGDYGEASLDPGENRLTVRNRIKAAAGRRQLGVDFRRTSGDLLRFQITENTNGTPKVRATRKAAAPKAPPAPAKRKGGRPKKSA